MKKKLAYLLLIVTAFAACKETVKTNAEDEAKKAEEQRKEIEAKCYEASKTQLMKTTFADTARVLDTLIINAIDTATGKMARENYCKLLLNVKEATDYYVDQQAKVVESAAKVSQLLVEPEQRTLEQAKTRQKVADANYFECMEALKTENADNYKYYQVTLETVSTRKNNTDTTEYKFYLDKETFDVKKF